MSKLKSIQGSLYGLIAGASYLIPTQLQLKYDTLAWMRGHLADFGIPAGITAIALDIGPKNKFYQFLSVIIPPSLCTLHELQIIVMDPQAMVKDPQDIACYFVGSLTAYGISRFYKEGTIEKLTLKIKNKFSPHSNLENIIT